MELANDKIFVFVGKKNNFIKVIVWFTEIKLDLAEDCFGYHNPIKYFKIYVVNKIVYPKHLIA